MNNSDSTLEVLKSLTPAEAKALRERFGISNKKEEEGTPAHLPTNGTDNGGSGGTPAPAILSE